VPHLISFDIDGTLETGNGPGPITLEMVRRAKEQGHIIGSCSDRPVGNQKEMWANAGIEVSFTVVKHRLDSVREQYPDAEVYFHIGDTNMDEHYAKLSGFEFVQVQLMEPTPWILNDAGEALWGPHGRGPQAMPPVEDAPTFASAAPTVANAAPTAYEKPEDDFATTG
jgi:hypothetical protein